MRKKSGVALCALLMLAFQSGQSAQNDRDASAADSEIPSIAGSEAEVIRTENLSAAGLFEQLQSMRRDLSQLRETVESQAQLLEQLRAEERDRYMDFQRRLARTLTPESPAPSDLVRNAGVGAAAESDDFHAAFALVRGGRYPEAIESFDSFIFKYPNSNLLPSAHYWLGELYFSSNPPDYERSRQQFQHMSEQFPNDRKMPDVLYKLALTYHRLNHPERARETLERTLAEYPDSVIARFAADYLRTELAGEEDVAPSRTFQNEEIPLPQDFR